MVRGAAIGTLILSGFGLLWVNWGAELLALPNRRIWLSAAGLLAFATACSAFAALRRGSLDGRMPEARRRAGRQFGWINLGQWAAILIAGLVSHGMHKAEWFPWAVSVIVGLHFFPLARIFRRPQQAAAGCAILAVDAIALRWTGLERAGLAALGTGCVLLGFAASAIPFLLRGLSDGVPVRSRS